MIIATSYPYPEYALDRTERVFQVQGRPHPYFPLNACKGIVDRHYVLTANATVDAVARECGCTVVPWDEIARAEGVLPGHQMNNAMFNYIKQDLGLTQETLREHTWVQISTNNVLVRRETIQQMLDLVEREALPSVYLSVRIHGPLGVVDTDQSMFSVLNSAPLELEEQYTPDIVRFDFSTCVSCERNAVTGRRRLFAHQVSEMEGLWVDSELKARLATIILDEFPNYHQIASMREG